MKLVKHLLGESPDYYGPLATIHAAEGEGCHRVCLDWLAYECGWLPGLHPIAPSALYPDPQRWDDVLARALTSFREFVTAYCVEPIGIEQEDFSAAYGLMGHVDLPCFITLPRKRRMKAVIDLKFTSSILESHRLQVRCYGRLDGMKDAQIGGIFQCNRDTGAWKFEPIDLRTNLDDVMAVSHAAKLWAWGKKRNSLYE